MVVRHDREERIHLAYAEGRTRRPEGSDLVPVLLQLVDDVVGETVLAQWADDGDTHQIPPQFPSRPKNISA